MSKFIARIDCKKITSMAELHDEFSRVFGFPDFYGRNMNAWIDCLSELDNPDAGMTSIHVEKGNIMVLELVGAKALRFGYRDIYDVIIECSSFVNMRRIELGQPALLALSMID